MAKFHIGENGPARCRALIRACPIGGDHFEHEGSAQMEYERQLRAQYRELETHRRDEQSAQAARTVGKIFLTVEGEWVQNVAVTDLRPADVYPDGRVVSSIEDERWMNIEGRENEGIGVYFMNEDSDYPPGFSYAHYPQALTPVEDMSPHGKVARVFRPLHPKEPALASMGDEIADEVSIKNLLPGDELKDGRTIAEMEDPYYGKVTVYFEPDYDGENELSVEPAEFPADKRFSSVYLRDPR